MIAAIMESVLRSYLLPSLQEGKTSCIVAAAHWAVTAPVHGRGSGSVLGQCSAELTDSLCSYCAVLNSNPNLPRCDVTQNYSSGPAGK